MPSSSKKTPTWVFIAGGAAAIAALAVLAFFLTSNEPGVTGSSVQETSSVTISGEDLPMFDPEAASDLAIGMALPTIEGENFAGEPVKISPQDGAQVVVIGAHWCPHCNVEVPKVVEWLDSEDAPDVPFTFLSTSTSKDQPNYPPSVWLDNLGWTEQALLDSPDGEAAATLGTAGFPYTIVVDKNGEIVSRTSGEGSLPAVQEAVATLN